MGFKENLISQLKTLTQAFSADDALGRVKYAGENIFGFYSPSGGNGVTTLVVNVADALRVAKKRVAVIDFDLMHPQVFRYLSNGQEECPVSMLDRWIDTTSDLSEYATMSADSFIATYSARLEDDVYALAELDIVAVTQFIKDVSQIYDYVLIDIHGNLNQETTVAALDSCTEIFTVIRPSSGDLESVYKDNLCTTNYNMGARFTNIIQAPIHQISITKQEFDEYSELPWKMVTNIPYVSEVAFVGQNYGCFVTSDVGTSAPAVAYRQAVKFVAETILNYYEPTRKEEVNPDGCEEI